MNGGDSGNGPVPEGSCGPADVVQHACNQVAEQPHSPQCDFDGESPVSCWLLRTFYRCCKHGISWPFLAPSTTGLTPSTITALASLELIRAPPTDGSLTITASSQAQAPLSKSKCNVMSYNRRSHDRAHNGFVPFIKWTPYLDPP